MSSYRFKKSENGLVYSFISLGLKGEIEKIVSFDPIDENEIYNLSLADNKRGRLEDFQLSNNNDVFKIFNTIADIVLDFASGFINVNIYFEGNTKAKNISYGRSLAKRVATLQLESFEVEGYKWAVASL